MKYHLFKYTLKVWVSSICLAALLFMIVWSVMQYRNQGITLSHVIGHYIMLLLFGVITALVSAPALGIFYLLILLGVKLLNSYRALKIWCNAAGLLVTLATFGLIFSFYPDYDKAFYLPLIATYCVIISVCVWFYKLKPRVATAEIQETT